MRPEAEPYAEPAISPPNSTVSSPMAGLPICLSFRTDGPADDHYHALTVKLVNRRNLTLRYRTGYLYSKEPATLKERFRQSIWQPRDGSEIGVTATPMRQEKGASLSLNIAATDLELAQQNERWVDQVGIFLALRDDSGLHARITGQSLQLRLTRPIRKPCATESRSTS